MDTSDVFGPSPLRELGSFKELTIGKLYVLYGAAQLKDDKLWGHTEPDRRLRTRHLLSLHFLERPDGRRVWGCYVGSFCAYWGWRHGKDS